MSAVKEFSLEREHYLLQPSNLKSDEFIEQLETLKADLFVVVAFRMLPEVVWSITPIGTINLHASLLPQYRGAAPINWAIINGERETGVTTFFIEKEIDTGKVIERKSIDIGPNETIGELYLKLMQLGADTTLSSVLKIMDGNVIGIPQDNMLLNEDLKSAPKIFKDDCKIDFGKSAQDVHNFCRGLDPFPGAWCELAATGINEPKKIKLFGSRLTDQSSNSYNQISVNNDGLLIPCSDFNVLFTEIQADGKRKMTIKDYLLGNNIEDARIAI
jgi:methionyl-tRNA formyltransferase